MTKYTKQTGKYNTTIALREKLRLCRWAVKISEKRLCNTIKANERQIVQYRKALRHNRHIPGMVKVIKKEITASRRQGILRLKPFQRAIRVEKRKLHNVISRIRRSQRSGMIYKIL